LLQSAEPFFQLSHLEDGLLVGRVWSVTHQGVVPVKVDPPPGLSLAEVIAAAEAGALMLDRSLRRLMRV
jgi:hypothetical protein